MQLLAEVGAGYVWAKDVWCEYFKATKGIHSLYWSKHLKAFFGINEVSDNQIASGVTDRNLQRFLDFPAHYFRRLSVDHKATLRKYTAFNQWDKASALLDELNIIHWKEYSDLGNIGRLRAKFLTDFFANFVAIVTLFCLDPDKRHLNLGKKSIFELILCLSFWRIVT